MTAISGVAGPAPRDLLERVCGRSLEAQSLYGRREPRFLTVEGASFGAALYETAPEDSNDEQPLGDGPSLLVADARIDNREELIGQLGDGRLTGTSTVSDIAIAGWRRWKTGLFDRIVGSFALAIFDSDTRTLFLARGPLGDRPLCYRIEHDSIGFASMPSGLGESGLAPNLEALARLMACGDMALGETAFARVQTVPPAHYLQWSPRGCRIVRFWHPPPVGSGRSADVVEEFRSILDQSVQCRLRRVAGPVATHLSAGLDSSAVTATAAALLPDRQDLIAFTMAPAEELPVSVPRGYLLDETPLASQTATALGIKHRIVEHSGSLLDCLDGHAKVYQAPVPNVTNHGWGYAIDQQASAAGARVLLSATQGNATLSYGSIDALGEWLKRGRFIDYLRQVRALVRSGAARWRGAIFYSIGDFVPAAVWNRLAGYLDETAADFFIRREWMERVKDDEVGSGYRAPGLRRDQYAMYAQNDPGLFVKATLAKSGLDERDPGADRRLIEFCLRLPADWYVNDGVTRRLAREGLADRLPDAIIANRLRGYQGADWFAKLDPREAMQWVERIEASPSAVQIIDLNELRRAIADWKQIGTMSPFKLRQWGGRFTRALAVGSFLRDLEREPGAFGRRGA
jgi:asparagine synthase (glutamine-hydrolysing)